MYATPVHLRARRRVVLKPPSRTRYALVRQLALDRKARQWSSSSSTLHINNASSLLTYTRSAIFMTRRYPKSPRPPICIPQSRVESLTGGAGASL